MNKFKSKYGPWAIVTGASSGIGLEFAMQLASNSFNLVITARRKNLLDNLAIKLESQFNIEVCTVVADLSTPTGIQSLKDATKSLDIGLLVNNAGNLIAGSFLKLDLKAVSRMQFLHITSPVELSYFYAQQMSAKGRGGIIFVSSIAGYQGTPYLANYSAAKAYLLSLGEALNIELKPQGIDVTVLCPGGTNTEMAQTLEEVFDLNKIPMMKMLMETSPTVAAGIKALGKKSTVVPGFMNKLMVKFMGKFFMSRRIFSLMMGKMFRKSLHKKYL